MVNNMNDMQSNKLVKLQNLRKAYNYTYDEMASKLNISKSYYWQIENGNRNLYYKVAIRIADIFKLKPDDIFFDDLK